MDPNKRGYLYKRAAAGIKKWNKRFFEVSGNNYLVYYSDESRKDPKMIDLSQAKAIISSNIGTTNVVNFINGDTLDTQLCFEIQCPHETHYLNAPNRKEYDSWLTTLNEMRSRAPSHSRNSSDITNSHLTSTTNPAFNNLTPFNSNPTNTYNSDLYPNINNTSSYNIPTGPALQQSPNHPHNRPVPSAGAAVTIVAFEPPVPFEFPDLTLSYSSFDCSWEKQLLTAIENEKETRANQLREREARLQNREVNSTNHMQHPSPMEISQPRPVTPVYMPPPPPADPPQPTFKDQVFLELVNERFDPDLVKRAFQLFPINEQVKLKNTSRIFAGLVGSGTPEDLFLEVYNLLKGEVAMVPAFVQSYQKLAEIGFPSYKCKEALMKFNMDHEKSVQWLLENS